MERSHPQAPAIAAETLSARKDWSEKRGRDAIEFKSSNEFEAPHF